MKSGMKTMPMGATPSLNPLNVMPTRNLENLCCESGDTGALTSESDIFC
jgi:hypothetical protein